MNKKYHEEHDTCRRCGHWYGCHCIYTRVEQGGMMQSFIHVLDVVPCSAASDITTSNSKACGCVNWEPQDNLEYLELKVAEKEQNDR